METMIWPWRCLPEIRVAGRFPLDDREFSYEYRAKTHALHVHLYRGVVKIGPNTFALAPGDVTLSPAGVASSYALAEAGHHWCVHFVPVAGKRGAGVELPWHFGLGAQRDAAVARLRHVSWLAARAKSARGLRGGEAERLGAAASAAFQEMLLWLAGVTRSPVEEDASGQRAERAIDQLVGILQTRFTEKLRVDELADEVKLSQNYLAKRFRARFGVTIPHYLLERRIDHARTLLADTNMSVRQIGTRVGMPDAQHFLKQFKMLAGVSPSAYRGKTA